MSQGEQVRELVNKMIKVVDGQPKARVAAACAMLLAFLIKDFSPQAREQIINSIRTAPTDGPQGMQ